MNYYEHESNNTAGNRSERHRPAWTLIAWKEIFDRLTDGTWPPEPIERDLLTSHLAHRNRGPGTRDAVAALIDCAIDDGVLEEHNAGEKVALHTERRNLCQLDVDGDSTVRLAHYVTPQL